MREAFVQTLCDIARNDQNAVLITGDLGFGALDNYVRQFPNQFINAGIAEQNMTGVATGMALRGKTVFTYSIANFPTLRCLEQIRNDAAYHDANVKIVALGGGLGYGPSGMSHHATEDLAIMRSIPSVSVFAPGDPLETKAAVLEAYKRQGTCYIRIGGREEPVHETMPDLSDSKAIKIISGEQVAVLSTGGILNEAKKAVLELKSKGVDACLYSFPCVKPIDRDIIIKLAGKASLLVTVEEHTVVGGFGSAVAEVICSLPKKKARQIMIGINDVFTSVVGSQKYLRGYYEISKDHIVEAVLCLEDK